MSVLYLDPASGDAIVSSWPQTGTRSPPARDAWHSSSDGCSRAVTLLLSSVVVVVVVRMPRPTLSLASAVGPLVTSFWLTLTLTRTTLTLSTVCSLAATSATLLTGRLLSPSGRFSLSLGDTFSPTLGPAPARSRLLCSLRPRLLLADARLRAPAPASRSDPGGRVRKILPFRY